MSKELPYFKFVATEWLTGNIVYESLETQGLFINICAMYWRKSGVLEYSEIESRYKKKAILAKLTDRFFWVSNGFIIIDFLNEQLVERQHVSVKNGKNGSKGGRPMLEKNKPKINPLETHSKPKKSNKEEEEEEEEEKNKNKNKRERESKTIEDRKAAFGLTLTPFKTDYSTGLLLSFFNYWTEHTPGGKKMRFELEKTWETTKRIVTWAANEEKFNTGGRAGKPPEGKMSQTDKAFANILSELQNDTGKQIGY